MGSPALLRARMSTTGGSMQDATERLSATGGAAGDAPDTAGFIDMGGEWAKARKKPGDAAQDD